MEVVVELYYPPGVREIIGYGSSSFIGALDDEVVLKYPYDREGHWTVLEDEARIYRLLGRHPRILGCFGLDAERGLLLEYASLGTLRDHLRTGTAPWASRRQWLRQAAEAVAYTHSRGVIHCDISTRNFLLDRDQELKLCDFQGGCVDADGRVADAFVAENTKSRLPRAELYSDRKSDLFALGSALYEIATGHEPFPELDEHNDHDEIERRYRDGLFPGLDDVLAGQIIAKCWRQLYDDAGVCAQDIIDLEGMSDTESALETVSATEGERPC